MMATNRDKPPDTWVKVLAELRKQLTDMTNLKADLFVLQNRVDDLESKAKGKEDASTKDD